MKKSAPSQHDFHLSSIKTFKTTKHGSREKVHIGKKDQIETSDENRVDFLSFILHHVSRLLYCAPNYNALQQ